jgi:ubiquinone biosynthesis protein COQ4
MPLSIMLIAGGLLKTLKTPNELDRLLDRIAVGYRIGVKAKPFLAQKWEEGWEKPLATWRSELGVEEMTEYKP